MDNSRLVKLLTDAALILEKAQDDIPGEIAPRDGLSTDIRQLALQARALRARLLAEE